MTPSMPAWKRFLVARILPWIVVLFGLAFVYLGVEETSDAQASVDWPTADGRIVRTSIERVTHTAHRAAPTTTWRPVIVYEYVVAGTRHQGDRVAFGEYATAERADAEAVVARYPLGATIKVSYDPADPQRSAIERGDVGIPWLWTALGSVFAAFGLLLVWLLPKHLATAVASPRDGGSF